MQYIMLLAQRLVVIIKILHSLVKLSPPVRKYGNDIQVTVEDDDGRWFLIDATELLNGDNEIYTNLHVYFK